MNQPKNTHPNQAELVSAGNGVGAVEVVASSAAAVHPSARSDPTVRRSSRSLRSIAWASFGSERVQWPIGVPLLALVLFTVAFRWTEWDLQIARQFFNAEQHAWPWFGSAVCTWFYRKGTYPAFGLGIASAAWLTWSLMRGRDWRSMQASVFLLLVLVVGPGLIVNLALKTAWGRPRPHQVEEFGGTYHFVPVGTPGTIHGHNSSFPSGHASVAFYLMTPAFLVGRRRPWLARGLLAAGLAYGGGMGAVRVIQGGHFASDVVWSAAIVYFTAALLAPLILRSANDLAPSPASRSYC